MRISWLESTTIRAAREILVAHDGARDGWAAYFAPDFVLPPAPQDIEPVHWARIADYVARRERVSQMIRERGIPAAMMAFRQSGHAVELTTLAAELAQADQLTFELVAAVLGCDIDEYVAYGPFLDLLQNLGKNQRERALAVYERFCTAFANTRSNQPMWDDRVAGVRDGLACFYVRCGHYDKGHDLFVSRHREDSRSLVVALAASRSFLAAGEVERACAWLGLGADRAAALGRFDMKDRLLAKQETLRRRQK